LYLCRSTEQKSTTGLGPGEDFAHRMLAKYGWQEGQGIYTNINLIIYNL
jgi:hypothetical protein